MSTPGPLDTWALIGCEEAVQESIHRSKKAFAPAAGRVIRHVGQESQETSSGTCPGRWSWCEGKAHPRATGLDLGMLSSISALRPHVKGENPVSQEQGFWHQRPLRFRLTPRSTLLVPAEPVFGS